MNFFEKIAALFFAICFSQAPLFVDQYTMRLEGHIEEAKHTVYALQDLAKGRGKTVEEYIEKFLQSSDGDIHGQGEYMQGRVDRLHSLNKMYQRLVEVMAILRPAVFIFACDSAICAETWAGFHVGFLCTAETMSWAVIGLFVAYFLIRMRRRKSSL